MSLSHDRQTKTAPPRESDEARQARFLRQTGLRVPFSAKQRRRLDTRPARRPNHEHRPPA